MNYSCKKHPDSTFYKNGKCKKCNVSYVIRRRKELKTKAVDFLGNKCNDCKISYDCIAVYDFHHLDPNTKDFNISRSGSTRSWEIIVKELQKCILLCSNCHRKRHYTENNLPSKVKTPNENKCNCGKKIAKKSRTCYDCREYKTINWPDFESLKSMVDKIGYSATGKQLSVSDNAVRKRLKKFYH